MPPKVEVVAVCLASGMIPLKTDSLRSPGICVMVAGFQNIDDRSPPAAMPAKDDPCPKALCSCTANPPAFAAPVAAIKAATPLAANRAAFTPRNDIAKPPCMVRHGHAGAIAPVEIIVPLESSADNA